MTARLVVFCLFAEQDPVAESHQRFARWLRERRSDVAVFEGPPFSELSWRAAREATSVVVLGHGDAGRSTMAAARDGRGLFEPAEEIASRLAGGRVYFFGCSTAEDWRSGAASVPSLAEATVNACVAAAVGHNAPIYVAPMGETTGDSRLRRTLWLSFDTVIDKFACGETSSEELMMSGREALVELEDDGLPEDGLPLNEAVWSNSNSRDYLFLSTYLGTLRSFAKK